MIAGTISGNPWDDNEFGRPLPPDGDNGDSGSGASGAASNISLITSSGGLAGFEQGLMIPCITADKSEFYMATFDVADFNTEDACEIWFRQEDIIEGREITVTRVRIVYEDLGKCTLTATVETAQQTMKEQITIGTNNPVGKTLTAYFDFVTTGERPQLKLRKEKDSGPLSLISATLVTGVEMAEQM